MEKLKNIIRSAGLSTCPEAYSGRGATTSDLNWKVLEHIYQGIIKEFGSDAGKSFLSMVEAMPVLSATAFLNELYSLARNGWEFTRLAGHSNLDVLKDPDGNYSIRHGIQVLGALLFSTGQDETEKIKESFLRMHIRRPRPSRQVNSYGY